MRVFYLTPGCFDKGGISRYSRYQITALRALLKPENVYVFSVMGPSAEDFEHPFPVTYYAGGPSTKRQRVSFMSRVYLAALSNRPDLILSAHINLSGAAKLLAKLTGAQSVLNVYGVETWSAMRRDAAWGLLRADCVISDCHYTARYLEANRWRPKDSVTVIWDCVDVERFFPATASPKTLATYGIPKPDEGFNIITLGRLSSDAAYKGYDRLLEVFAKVAQQVQNVRLIYAGRGDLVDKLRGRACDLGLRDRVFFTGMIHEDDLPDVYRSGHIFSLVAERGEGMGEGIPLTPLEAAACGVPLIVGNHDGSQEAVVDGVTGYMIDPFDLDKHAQHIVSLATDENLRIRMGAAARARAELEFAFPKFQSKHEELLTRWCSYNFGSGMLPKQAAQMGQLNI